MKLKLHKTSPKDFAEDIEYMRRTGIPRCPTCKEDMVNARDSITKKISKYIWKASCECISPNMRLMRG